MTHIAFAAVFVLGALAAAVLTSSPAAADAEQEPYYFDVRQPSVRIPTLLAPGLSVGGTLVGGLTTGEAQELIARRFSRLFTLVIGAGRTIPVTPEELGARPNVAKALHTAIGIKRHGFLVPLDVEVSDRRIDRLLDRVAKDVNTPPRDARLVLRGLRPVVIDAKPGSRLDRDAAKQAIRQALRAHLRGDVVLPVAERPAQVLTDDLRTAIVIKRGSNRLDFYVDQKLNRTFSIATGLARYPTPLGRFSIMKMQRHPTWYPPTTSDWAKGLQPVPPGPGNPLGTRWMGLTAPLVGIHGTPDAASIGYSASHGCIRMLIPEVEWLFERVDVGTPVFIVPA